MSKRWFLSVVLGLIAAWPALAADLAFYERFALAEDRAEVLKELVPGTEDYYYFHCLYYQQIGEFDEVEPLLEAWVDREGTTERVVEIRHRQALLLYPDQSEKSLEYLRSTLGLHFDHQRQVPGEAPNLPTSLDQALISRAELLGRALSDSGRQGTVDGFRKSAYDWLLAADLDAPRLHALLERLEHPDYEHLPELIDKEMRTTRGSTFGSLRIHGLLTREQLDALLALREDLLNTEFFIQTYIARLAPGNDAERQDPAVHGAYLERLDAFVTRLGPAHMSLKAHVLYHRLTHNLSQGVYDKELFLRYLNVPRHTNYIAPVFLREKTTQFAPADLGRDFRDSTALPPIESDEELVRTYLEHFLATADNYDDFSTYIEENYLRRVFAETKLLLGEGDLEQWYSWLDPATVDALKNRVDLEFMPSNRQQFLPEEAVNLALWVKHVDRLLVKIFEIDPTSYYQHFQRPLNMDIDLDGLVPNSEEVYTYTETPLRRVQREFAFPQLQGRGVWVIEFVGNGKSSRALIEKGRLSYLSRTSGAGQMLTVFDEKGKKLPAATVWFGDRTYTADEQGEIALPFSTSPGNKPVVLQHDGFATLDTLQHQGEDYQLTAGFHLESETLQPNEMAKAAVRAQLYLNGTQAPVTLLDHPVLTLHTMTHDGIASTQQVQDLALENDALTTHEFRVPENLSEVRVTLSGDVARLINDEPVQLSSEQVFPVKTAASSINMASLLLTRAGQNYILEFRDKTGLPLPDRAIYFSFTHMDFVDPANFPLKTDSNGQVHLGPLHDIDSLEVSSAGTESRSWNLETFHYDYPSDLRSTPEARLSVPYASDQARLGVPAATLLEVRRNAFTKNFTDQLVYQDGYVVLPELEDGDYLLHIKADDVFINVKITEGTRGPSYVASDARLLEALEPSPLQIESVATDETQLKIKIGGANTRTRVHVVATHYVPDYPVFQQFDIVRFPGLAQAFLVNGAALYQSGRNIGDEYRYILERRFAAKFPGNMLDRPSLLLNPWALQETQAEQAAASAPEPPPPASPPAAERLMEESDGDSAAREAAPPGFPDYNFAEGQAAVLYNLQPDDNGEVIVPLAELGGRPYLQIAGTDLYTTVSRNVSLDKRDLQLRDLRLAKALDTDGEYVEKKQIRVVDKGETIEISRIGEASIQVYDSLPEVYGLFMALNDDATLREFEFVTRWPSLSDAEKQAKYAKYACHELNFFLYQKDRAFFDEVVAPFLRNKKDMTFMDLWLLGEDVQLYMTPWRYEQLNAAEKILVAKRVALEMPQTLRYVEDVFDMVPPNPDRDNMLFMTALYGGGLAGDALAPGTTLGFALDNGLSNRALGRAGGGGFGGSGEAGLPAMAMDSPAEERAELEALGYLNGEAADESKALHEEVLSRKRVEHVGRRADLEAATDFFHAEADRLKSGRERYLRLYQAVEKTKEWVENNYYHLPVEQTTANLISVNAFWRDFAAHAGDGPFRSIHIAEATRNFPEMMFALAVLELPFESADHNLESNEQAHVLEAGGPGIAYYKEVQQAEAVDSDTPILVSQNYFRADDRYRYEGNQQFDKFVKDEFLVGVVYGCQVTATNPTSTPHQLELLRQIPAGAVPLGGARYTQSERFRLDPYSTARREYYFYFPLPGVYDHFPVHASENGRLLASVAPQSMNVVEEPSLVDMTSWQFISQMGAQEDVLEFLGERNVNRYDLSMLAWRMKDALFYQDMLNFLKTRHVYTPVLWSYSVFHNDPEGLRTFLRHQDAFLAQAGPILDCPLFSVDPVDRKFYQHVEYAPLINPRAHDLDYKWTITNDQLRIQFAKLMNILAHKPVLDENDYLSITYYMLLQDRVAEGLEYFKRVKQPSVSRTMAYDYFKAYLAFYEQDVATAREIAAKYVDYPVERWRGMFRDVLAQAAEIAGEGGAEGKTQDEITGREAQLELELKDNVIVLHHARLTEATLSFYPIDLEMLFTRSPFAPAGDNLFAGLKPASSQVVRLDGDAASTEVPMPGEFLSAHVAIKVEAGGLDRSEIRYASQLTPRLIERYGQITVLSQDGERPLPQVYVKTYARMHDGQIEFYRDGYTDLRGRFDYAASSTLDIANVAEFAILVMSEEYGARVLTAQPPAR